MGVKYFSREINKEDIDNSPILSEKIKDKHRHIFIATDDIDFPTYMTDEKTNICRIEKDTIIYIKNIKSIEPNYHMSNRKDEIDFYYFNGKQEVYEEAYVTEDELMAVDKKLKLTDFTEVLQKKYNKVYDSYMDDEDTVQKKCTISLLIGAFALAFLTITPTVFFALKGYTLLAFVIPMVFATLSCIIGEYRFYRKVVEKYMKEYNIISKDGVIDWKRYSGDSIFDSFYKEMRCRRKTVKDVLKDAENIQALIKDLELNPNIKRDIEYSLSDDNEITVKIDSQIINKEQDPLIETKTTISETTQKNPTILSGDWQTFPNSPLQLFVTEKTATQ